MKSAFKLIPFIFGRPSQVEEIKKHFINNKNFVSVHLDEFTHFTNTIVVAGPISMDQKEHLDHFIKQLNWPKKIYYFGDEKGLDQNMIYGYEKIKEVLNDN